MLDFRRKTPILRKPGTSLSENQHGGQSKMAATSGDVCVIIANCCRVQHRHRRADTEARKNRFPFRIFAGIAFHSEPRHGGQLARVSIDYYRDKFKNSTITILHRLNLCTPVQSALESVHSGTKVRTAIYKLKMLHARVSLRSRFPWLTTCLISILALQTRLWSQPSLPAIMTPRPTQLEVYKTHSASSRALKKSSRWHCARCHC